MAQKWTYVTNGCLNTPILGLLGQMDVKTKAKLEAVLGRKAELEVAARVAEDEGELAAQRRIAERQAIKDRWDQSTREIDAAISAINTQTSNAKLSFSAALEPRKTDHPGLAQMSITLTAPDQPREKRLVLNVSALGLVQPVALIPHIGPKIADFRIQEADQAKYESVLVEVLDGCFTEPKDRKRP
jgi:hypothetical protein